MHTFKKYNTVAIYYVLFGLLKVIQSILLQNHRSRDMANGSGKSKWVKTEKM